MGRKKKVEQVQEDSLQFLKDYLKIQKDEYIYELNFEGKTIEIYQYLSVENKAIFVDLVVAGSFHSEKDIVVYKPIYRDLLFKFYTLKYFTNIELPDDDFTGVYDLFIKSGLYFEIVKNIPSDEIGYLEDMVDIAIDEEFRIIEQENTFVNVAKSLMKQFSGMDFEGMTKQLESLKESELIKGLMDGKLQ